MSEVEEMNAERWLPLPNRPGHKVSDQGRVLGPRGIMKGRPDHGGYMRVGFDFGRIKRSVHSLVMLAFVGERPKGFHIDHIDGDRANNRLANLRYVSRADNERNKVALGTAMRGARNHRAKLSAEQVIAIRQEYTGQRGQMAELGRRYGVHYVTIYEIVSGRNWAWLATQPDTRS